MLLTIKDYDKANLWRWLHFFPSCTFWCNAEVDTIKHVRNEILKLRPGLDQDITSIYPFLALRRVGIPGYFDADNLSAVNRGEEHHLKEERMLLMLCVLTYHLDVYAANREDFDDLCVELQENVKRNPYVKICSEDPELASNSFTMDIQEFVDNTDLESFNETSPIYRATLVYTINAKIFRRERFLNAREINLDITRIRNIDEIVRESLKEKYGNETEKEKE